MLCIVTYSCCGSLLFGFLRQAPDDPTKDKRRGLDEFSFAHLGSLLPKDTFLVTNQVEWFDYFGQNYQWNHPDWQIVAHSGAMMHKSWGLRQPEFRTSHAAVDVNQQKMQLWADWYTLLTAKTVYHTDSAFSESAIRWQNIDSKIINGYNVDTKQFELLDETWRQRPPEGEEGGVAPALVDRLLDGKGKMQLRDCKPIYRTAQTN